MRIEDMDPIKFLHPARVALIAFLALPCSLCLAEDRTPTPAAQPVPADPSFVSIDFPGGPLSKLVASLGGDKDTKLSIIQSAGLDPIMPAFSVHNVRVDAVIAALGQIVEPQGYTLRPVGPNLAVLARNDSLMRPPAFASFQLESKVNARSGRTAEEVIAAIQLGCEFADPGRSPSTLRFKYHPGTKLLFVAGTRQEIDVAHQVFGSLPDSPTKEPPAPPEKK